MSATATASFPVRYAAAYKALAEAKRHTAPMDAELAAMLQDRYPEKFAKMEADVAAIAATIPALQAEYDRLDALACGRCAGTGEYQGASRIYKRGIKMCFDCGGSGQRRQRG